MGDTFFGIQLAVESAPRDPWRQLLAERLRRWQRDLGHDDQRTLFGGLANHLREALARCPLGYWDLVRDGRAEFEEWQQGLEDDSAETWAPDPSGAKLDHALITLLFLVPAGSPADQLLGERCDLPEAHWLLRDTFAHLLETVAMLPFEHVRRTGVYLTPGGVQLAFSLPELRGTGYEYLEPLG
jgi:hypothetical protein